MPEVPEWAMWLAAGTGFGFGVGGAWVAMKARSVALATRVTTLEKEENQYVRKSDLRHLAEDLERVRDQIKELHEDLVEKHNLLRQDHVELSTIVIGPTGRNGMSGEQRHHRDTLHDIIGWIQKVSMKLDIDFERRPRGN